MALAACRCAEVWRSDGPDQFAAYALARDTFVYSGAQALYDKGFVSYLSAGNGIYLKCIGQHPTVVSVHVTDLRIIAFSLGCCSILCDPHGK